MTNFIVSGDQHIKVSKEVPLEWQLNRYTALWDKYIELCKGHSAHLILAGDMFHSAKFNQQEARLFIDLCCKLSDNNIDTWIISGNHDALSSELSALDFFVPLFDKLGRADKGKIFYHYGTNHYGWGTAEFPTAEAAFTFVGHQAITKDIKVEDLLFEAKTKILISHFRPNVNQFIKEEIDVEKFIAGYDLCICGDIHMPLTMFGDRLIYTNSPLGTHFESAPECGVVLLTIDTGSTEWKRISLNLPAMIQKSMTPEEYEEFGTTKADDNLYRIEVTGTSEELRKLKPHSELIQLRKVPEVVETYTESEDAVEIRDVGLEESLIGYMKELQLENIEELMSVYREA